MTDEAPSQHREGLDHLWAALKQGETVTKASAIRLLDVGESRGKKVTGWIWPDGDWPDVTRTQFRDRAVLAAVHNLGPVSMKDLTDAFEGLASVSQTYGSLARLRKAGSVKLVPTETRTPIYETA